MTYGRAPDSGSVSSPARGGLLVLFAASITMLSRLWEGDLHRDAVLYAAVAKGIATHGDWLDLQLGDDPYWRKPPVMFWLAATMFKLGDVSTFGARFFPAVFGVLACVALYRLARTLFDERVGLIAGLVLATTPSFIRNASTFSLDPGVTLCTLVSLGCLIRGAARGETRSFVLGGALWGVAVMIKGAFGLLGPFAFVIYLGAHREWRLLASRGFALSLVAAAAVALPWHLYELARWGPAFVQTYLGQEIVDRIAGRLDLGRQASYVMAFCTGSWPWVALTAIGVVPAVNRARHGDRNALFILCWAIGYLLLLYASAGRRTQYLLHLYPVAAVVTAIGVDWLFPQGWPRAATRAVVAALATAGFVLLVIPIRIHPERSQHMKALAPILEVLEAAPGAPLIGFRTSTQLRASSLFYLDRDVHARGLARIPRTASTLVLTRRHHAADLRAAGFLQLHENPRYVLLRPPHETAATATTAY
jgi:4-amino-4-deoxy-L-arabinose transferase-like glycosyltransferase